MRIKLDECIPNSVSGILQAAGHDVETVHQERLSGSSDSVIWDVAQTERRFLITTDLDFSDIRKHIPGAHQGILLFDWQGKARAPLLQCSNGFWNIME